MKASAAEDRRAFSSTALSTDLGFALTIAREVHGAGWVVDELLDPARSLKKVAAHF